MGGDHPTRRIAAALALGAVTAAQLTLRAVDVGLDPLRQELERGVRQGRSRDHLRRTVARDIERM